MERLLMNWLGNEGESFEQVLALRPELQRKYTSFLESITSSGDVPVRVFNLCRARVQQIHGREVSGVTAEEAGDLERQDLSRFTDAEQKALAAAERIPFQHHMLADDEVSAISNAFGEAGCVALLTALAFFDVTCRLNAAITEAA
jgi:alkylhydroperoxidase family enzyme